MGRDRSPLRGVAAPCHPARHSLRRRRGRLHPPAPSAPTGPGALVAEPAGLAKRALLIGARPFASAGLPASKDAARTRLRSSVPIPPAQARPSPDATELATSAAATVAGSARTDRGRSAADLTANCAPQAAAPFSESVPRFRPHSLRSSPPPRRGGAGRPPLANSGRAVDAAGHGAPLFLAFALSRAGSLPLPRPAVARCTPCIPCTPWEPPICRLRRGV